MLQTQIEGEVEKFPSFSRKHLSSVNLCSYVILHSEAKHTFEWRGTLRDFNTLLTRADSDRLLPWQARQTGSKVCGLSWAREVWVYFLCQLCVNSLPKGSMSSGGWRDYVPSGDEVPRHARRMREGRLIEGMDVVWGAFVSINGFTHVCIQIKINPACMSALLFVFVCTWSQALVYIFL